MTRVALIGAAGHGAWHRMAIDALGGRVRLVGSPGGPGMTVGVRA